MASKHGRFLELEGLRGVAAICVVGYHFVLAFYAFAVWGPGVGDIRHSGLESIVFGNPAMVFLSGTFSVAIFFVLSGFVLSIGFFQTGGKLEIIKKLAAKRYLRLMIPALASVLIAYILLKSDLSHVNEAVVLSHSPWLTTIWTVTPHLIDALYNGLIGAFVLPNNPYNAVLWTMSLEFLGSLLVFGFLALLGNTRYRPLLYAGLIIISFNTWFMPFFAGMILADLYASGRLRQAKRNLLYAIPILLVGLFLGGFPIGELGGTVYQGFAISSLKLSWLTVYLSLGAILVVGVVLTTTQVANIFKLKWIAVLGKYTFSLYLVHTLILFTLTTGLFVTFHQSWGLGYNRSFVLSTLISIPVLVGATYLFERYVDAKSIKFSSWAAGLMLSERSFSPDFLLGYRAAYDRAFSKLTQNPETIPAEEIQD